MKDKDFFDQLTTNSSMKLLHYRDLLGYQRDYEGFESRHGKEIFLSS
jgi:hypothetical protein